MINILYQSGALITIDEPILTYHKPKVYVMVHSFFFGLLRAIHMAHGSSQARGQIVV